MTQWQPLSRQAHADACYRPRWDFAHARERALVPAMLGELAKLITHYVLVFIEEQGQYRPMAILSAPGQENLYLRQDGKWAVPYVPAALRAHPFSLLRAEGKADPVMAVEAASLREPGEGEPLFDDQGELTEGVQRAARFLEQMEGQKQRTARAADALQAAGILQPWPLALPVEGKTVAVKGLHRVDEAALNALDAETYATLQGAPMQLAYAQLYAQSQIEQLTQRAELQDKLNAADTTPDLDAVFGEDDELGFDFD